MDRPARVQNNEMDFLESCSLQKSMQQIYRTAQSLNASAMHHHESSKFTDNSHDIFRHFPIPPNYFNVGLLNSALSSSPASIIPPRDDMLHLVASSSCRSDSNPLWQGDPRIIAAKTQMSLSSKYQQILAKSSFSVTPICSSESVNLHNSFAPGKIAREEQFPSRSRNVNAPKSGDPPSFGSNFESIQSTLPYAQSPFPHHGIAQFKRQFSLPPLPTRDDHHVSKKIRSADIMRSPCETSDELEKPSGPVRCSSPVSLSPPSALSHPRKSNYNEHHTLPALAPLNSPCSLALSQGDTVAFKSRSPNEVSQASTSYSKPRAHSSRSPSSSENSFSAIVPPFLEKVKSSPESVFDDLDRFVTQDTKYSYHSQDTSCSDDSFQSSYRSRPSRPDNSFLFAHQDNFGVTPERARQTTIGEPPDLIRISDDYDDDDYDDDDYYSDDDCETVVDPQELELLQRVQPDLTSLTASEVLGKIDLPPLKLYEPNEEDLSSYLSPQEIGHINYLIKCHADSVITIAIPSYAKGTKVISPLDYLDIHINGVLQIYFILYKCEDFLNFTVVDQLALLENGILAALISLGIPMYNDESNSWNIPSALEEAESFPFQLEDLLQIIPKPVVDSVTILLKTSRKLNIDWTIAILMLLIFIYTPTDQVLVEIVRIDKLRDKYVQIMLKYCRWRWGIRNAALLFPELLKFMDAVFKLCQEIMDYQLRLSDEEIASLKARLNSMDLSFYYDTELGPKQSGPELGGEITYAALHTKLCGLLLCSMHGCDNFSQKVSDYHRTSNDNVFQEDNELSFKAISSANRMLEPFRNTELLCEPSSDDKS